jgi:4-amino-4-deoxy-L-arabinose transferase-like glycosyltransferase
MFSKNRFTNYIIFVLILLSVFTRFVKLDWGNGYFFHPDENNMATSLSQLKPHDLNPRFFAYGQFPLYLGYFTLSAMALPNNFPNSIFMLRFWSAVFSLLSLLFFFLIARKLFSHRIAVFALLLSVFSPGLIQISHFGTTESLLVFAFISAIYFSLKIIDHPAKLSNYLLASIVIGISLSSKISALIFFLPLIFAVLMSIPKSTRKISIIINTLFLFIFSFALLLIFSPYNILAKTEFLSTLNYETGVAMGKIRVFYTNQFRYSIPYLFQMLKVFPYISGIPQFLLSAVGVVYFYKYFLKSNQTLQKYWMLILVPSLIYFLYFGQLFVKWTRFVSPVFLIIPLFAAFTLSTIKRSPLQLIILIICCLPGIYFLNLYLNPDIRILGSGWFEQNIPPRSKVLSEAGNVIDFPLSRQNYNIVNFDFYGLDNDLKSPLNLVNQISQSDYIIVPSRRVFKNQSTSDFPYSKNYYTNLFNGNLGFTEIKQFTPHTDLLLDPENAEETWSVFDRPTIRIYKKIQKLTWDQYRLQIIPAIPAN